MYLSEETKQALESILGESVEKISEMDFDQEMQYVEQKTGKPIKFSKIADYCMISRGNPLIIRRRIATMEDINKKLEKL